jgi:hypothetical protein
MDGIQTPGINYNSIDGLTAINANSISINGSTINLNSYIPYVGAIQNPNLNAKQLKNIANGSAPQDAAAFSQIPSITGLVPYTLAVSNVDLNAKQLKNLADGTDVQDAITLSQFASYRYNTIQNGAGDCYVNTGLSNLTLQAGPSGTINLLSRTTIQPASNSTDVFKVKNAAGTSIFHVDTLTSAISCNTIVNVNSNKIINVANGTTTFDAVNYGQLSAIPGLPAGSVQGSYIIYNGSGYINNASGTVNLGNGTGTTGAGSVNIGTSAGTTSISAERVAIGNAAGGGTCGQGSIAIGSLTGTSQGIYSVAIGAGASFINTTGQYAISIGYGAGNYNPGNNSIAIGNQAGWTTQGNNTIAIGQYAGESNQNPNSIILNATGSPLNSLNNSALYVAPIRRNETTSLNNCMMYNTTTKEVCYMAQNNWNPTFINGDISVNQRNTGYVLINGVFMADRWLGEEYTNLAGFFTFGQQLTLDFNQSGTNNCPPNTNFKNCMRIYGSADNATNGTMFKQLISGIESKTLQQLLNPQYTSPGGVSTQTYQTVCLSFWARSSVANYKFSVGIKNSLLLIGADKGMGQVQDITTSTANTWARYTIVFNSGSRTVTAGGFDFTENLLSADVQIIFAKGATFASARGTPNGVWTSSILYQNFSTVPFTQLTAGHTFDFTGFQWDIDQFSSPYRPTEYRLQLQYCQRYYNRITAQTARHIIGMATPNDITYSFCTFNIQVKMRIMPLLNYSAINCITIAGRFSGSGTSNTVLGVTDYGDTVIMIYTVMTGSGEGYWMLNTIGAWIDFTAE